MHTTALTGPFGVAVHGVDLRNPFDASTNEQLRVLLAQHSLLVFHDADLRPDDQIRLLAVFGDVVDEGGDGKRYVYVSNYREDGVLALGKQLLFHSDNVFTPDPLNVISLYGERIAPDTAPTRFANAVRACAQLRADQRAALADRVALHLTGFAGGYYRYRDAEVEAHHPRAWHPVITTDTYSQQPALMVSEQQTDRIDGFAGDASEATLHELFAALYNADNVYTHAWQQGDLVVWDNLAVQHGRPELTVAGERTLRRVVSVTRAADSQRAWNAVSRAAEAAERSR